MKTIIVGGGKGCQSLLGLAAGSLLKEFTLNILAVVDLDSSAPGMNMARSLGIDTYSRLDGALQIPGIELIIELTGDDAALQEIYKKVEKGIRIMDHVLARVFWDVHNATEEKNWQLKELDKLERRLAEERTFLQAIFDSSEDLLAVLDKDFTIKRANRRFAEYIGLEKVEIIGKRCYEVLINTDIDCDKKDLEDVYYEIFQTGEAVTRLKVVRQPEEKHWEITRSPILGPSGNIEYILSTWHRITERIRLQREIESAEQKFKSFIYSAQDWISIKGLDGKYVIVNPVTAKALNKKAKDFEGKGPEEVLPKKLAKTINKHDDEVIKSRQPRTYDEIFPVGGERRHFQTVRFPLTDYKGEIIGVCTIARDVTKERALLDQLVQSEKLASLGKLAAGVAHEINNPLTGIMAYAEALKEETNDEEQKEDLDVIIRETLRCRDIVRNLLDFARQDKPELQKNHPSELIGQVISLVKRLPQFKDVKIDIYEGENVPNIESDLKQMIQVLLNLMINAADAMKYHGEITLSTEYDRKSGKCVISVEDNGPGIPENLVDKIFEPFFSTKGTNGLGLAVSWGIIERHHGSIEIDMADGGGAVFKILLPAIFRKKN